MIVLTAIADSQVRAYRSNQVHRQPQYVSPFLSSVTASIFLPHANCIASARAAIICHSVRPSDCHCRVGLLSQNGPTYRPRRPNCFHPCTCGGGGAGCVSALSVRAPIACARAEAFFDFSFTQQSRHSVLLWYSRWHRIQLPLCSYWEPLHDQCLHKCSYCNNQKSTWTIIYTDTIDLKEYV